MNTQAPKEHTELMFALGAMHSDLKNVMKDVANLTAGTTSRMDGHSRRIGSLENTRMRLVAYAAGLSAGIFTIGSFLRDKLFTT